MNPEELEYYRAVEDLFARLRGTPFLLSPKDFALLRRWWEAEVPLAAVTAGLGEVFARRAAAGDEPVSSLAYCRHAVAKHAKRLVAAPGVGGTAAPADLHGAVERLATGLREAAARWSHAPEVAAVLYDLLRAIESLPEAADPAAADEALGRLELAALDLLAAALPDDERARIESAVAHDLAVVDLDADARARTTLALRRKRVREAVGLPRLEVLGDGR